jgi:hypothetical protein
MRFGLHLPASLLPSDVGAMVGKLHETGNF